MALAPVQSYLATLTYDLQTIVFSFAEGQDLLHLSSLSKKFYWLIKKIVQECPEPKKRMYELRMVSDMKQLTLAFSKDLAVLRVCDILVNNFSFSDFIPDRWIEDCKTHGIFLKCALLQKVRSFSCPEFEILKDYNEKNQKTPLNDFLIRLKNDFMFSESVIGYISLIKDYLINHYNSFLANLAKNTSQPKVLDETKEKKPSTINQMLLEAFLQFARNEAWFNLFTQLKMLEKPKPNEHQRLQIDQCLILVSTNIQRDIQNVLNAVLANEACKSIVSFFNDHTKIQALTKFFAFSLDFIYIFTDEFQSDSQVYDVPEEEPDIEEEANHAPVVREEGKKCCIIC